MAKVSVSQQDLMQFAADVLTGLGITPSPENVTFMLAWEKLEGGWSNGALYNPWNTTLKMPGSTNFNSNGGFPVQSYPDRQTGVRATIQTLSKPHYASVVAALKGTDQSKMAAAVDSSPWCAGCYAGKWKGVLASANSAITSLPGQGIASQNTSQVINGIGNALDPSAWVGSLLKGVKPVIISGVLLIGAVALVVMGLSKLTDVEPHQAMQAGLTAAGAAGTGSSVASAGKVAELAAI